MLDFPLLDSTGVRARNRLLASSHFVNFIYVIYTCRGKLGGSCHRLIIGKFPAHIVCRGDRFVGSAFTRFPFEQMGKKGFLHNELWLRGGDTYNFRAHCRPLQSAA